MKKKIFFLLTGFILPLSGVYAQYAEDALRFSQTEQGATARFRALGNAQTAVGGDLSSFAGNPAGLGLFTRSDISLTTSFNNSGAKAGYFGENTNTQLDKLGLDQFGIVWHSSSKKPAGSDLNTGWLGFNFGLSYNKSNNFNVTLDYSGQNNQSSFADFLADNGNNTTFYEGDLTDMAYKNYLISFDDNSSIYNGYFPITAVGNQQNNIVYRSGSQSEVNFGFGANYSNRLFIGATLGLTSVNYHADREFRESGLTLFEDSYANEGFDFDLDDIAEQGYFDASYSLLYRSNQSTTGSGINGKIGFIYRPVSNLRVGMSFETPSWYSISDKYSEGLSTRYTLSGGGSSSPETLDDIIYDYNYNLRTPYKINGGLAFIFGQGLITGDVEYVDYSSMHFSSSDNQTDINVNRDIRNTYQSAVNYRIGGEYKLDNVYLRAGYNTKGNPYKNFEYSQSSISGGIGYRINNFYIDAAYVNSVKEYSQKPYSISEDYIFFDDTGAGNAASIKENRGSVFLTVGTRF